MMILKIQPKHFFSFIVIWWTLFMVLSTTGFNDFNLLNIIGFSFLVIVPGLLTVAAIEQMNVDLWGYFCIIIGLSLIEIITICLVGNVFLPFAGVARPLDKNILLGEITFLTGILLVVNFLRKNKYEILIKKYLIFDNFLDFVFAFMPLIFVMLSIIGAVRLNNGESNIFIFVMLIGIGIYIAILIGFSRRLSENVIPIALFFVSLSLLLMTSLRGWYITGHDVQREYRVFELAKNNGIWLVANFRDAYNACMSITILPTIFYNVLKFYDPYVFKFFFQVIFAIVPGIVYLIARRYVSKAIALISVVYFIAFPTFFGDMPMLNRQEIAFVFLALMFYVIFRTQMPLFIRQVFFVIFGLGMVLSHYSTTYTVIALLIFLVISRPVLYWLANYFRNKKIILKSSIKAFEQNEDLARPFITVLMVICLVVASFLWSSVLTDTSSSSISRVLTETISVIRSNANEDTRSGDVLYSLFSWKKLDQEALLKEYQEKVVSPLRSNGQNTIYYDIALRDRYKVKPVPTDMMPLTSLGKFFQSRGIDVVSFNYNFRQLSAKALQVLILFGLIFVLYSNRYTKKTFDTEFILLVVGSLVFVLSQVLLPVLSVEYGLLRAFQQSLIFLGIFAVIGSLALSGDFPKKKCVYSAGLLAIIFFLSSTGVFTQSLGGYDPQLHLNNDGTGYDLYYLHSSEVAGIYWLGELLEKDKDSVFQAEIQTDRYISTKMTSVREISPLDDIYPELIRKDSYIYLGFTNVHKEKASTFYKGTLIMYKYPVDFLDNNKNLIYNNGDVKIYR